MKKELNSLDELLLSFVPLLKKVGAKFVVVSGYVAILYGRSRTTEDIDVLVEEISKEKFERLWKEAKRKGFVCINTTEFEDAFSLFKEGVPLRFAKKSSFIPNIEIKRARSVIDKLTLKMKKRVKLKNETIFISPLEMQIAYKQIIFRLD